MHEHPNIPALVDQLETVTDALVVAYKSRATAKETEARTYLRSYRGFMAEGSSHSASDRMAQAEAVDATCEQFVHEADIKALEAQRDQALLLIDLLRTPIPVD